MHAIFPGELQRSNLRKVVLNLFKKLIEIGSYFFQLEKKVRPFQFTGINSVDVRNGPSYKNSEQI
jgi:hypothetical protein